MLGLNNRVVITGLGAITPIGIGKDTFFSNLLAGKSGIDKITRFDPTGYTSQIAGEVKGFSPETYMDKKEAKRMDRYSQFAIAASKMALEDAKINLETEDRDRMGTYIGAGIGGIETMHEQYKKLFEKGPSKISPFFIPMMIGNMAAGHVAINFSLTGPSCCMVTACATGSTCIGEAFHLIQSGRVEVMLAGGTEASISPAAVAGFASMKALCTDHNDDPAHASRPFDKTRSGFVMGEGAGIVVLEELSHAMKRGARIYAEIAGYGANSDAYHITAPAPEGKMSAKCIELALYDAQMKPEEIDYVNAHGTSTVLNDASETAAIKKVFGEYAKNMGVSSIKSMTGHLLGAAGGVECIATTLAVHEDIMPPTINYHEVDEGMDLNYVANEAQKKVVRAAISNNFGFGGHNACLLIKKFVK